MNASATFIDYAITPALGPYTMDVNADQALSAIGNCAFRSIVIADSV